MENDDEILKEIEKPDILSINISDDVDYDIFEDELAHYGTPRHSGRYPWGSGDDPYQHEGDFLSRVSDLRSKGMTETEIARAMGMSTTQYRAAKSLASSERRKALVAQAKSLAADGLGPVAIGEKMGYNESTIRSFLNSDSEARMNLAQKTAENLKALSDKYAKEDGTGMIDVGIGTEKQLGISKEKLNTALEILKMEGYEVWGGRIPQATMPGQYTTFKVLCQPGTTNAQAFDYAKHHYVDEYTSRDGGDTFEPSFRYPASLDSKRLAIRYREDGGIDKDGVVEIRRGVKDLSLGNSNYAQVRILVDGTHYIKGMAVYSDNLPDGVDLVFNTNKKKGTPVLGFSEDGKADASGVLKPIKKDPENPFGSAIKENGGQSYYDDPNGKYTNPLTGAKQSLSLINKRSDEGDWNEWSNKLPSQFLSKQPQQLIKKQINLSIADKEDELSEIMNCTNPTIKKSMLETFADDCDSASIHLKAASLPGQNYKVILPVSSLKDNEIYDPDYVDGTELVLIRYPHAGTFEIPRLIVNNHNQEGIRMLGNTPSDAVGINSNVAARLSGADFDGDTVMVIPTKRTNVKSTPPLKELEGFDPTLNYGPDEPPRLGADGKEHYYRGGHEYRIMSNTQTEMGIISNLITDMTLKGANEQEIARAVKHSMVVIDAEKHKLDYRQSYIDNNIDQLKEKYQRHYDPITKTVRKGASTLISQAKSEIDVYERKEGAYFAKDTQKELEILDSNDPTDIDPNTGKRIKRYIDPESGKTYTSNDVFRRDIDPVTGKKLYHLTKREYATVEYVDDNGKKQKASAYLRKDGKYYYKDANGNLKEVSKDDKLEVKRAMQKLTRMEAVDDARQLSSGFVQEELYAEYANRLKDLANTARIEYEKVQPIPYSPSAKAVYKDEVTSLDYKLRESQLNAPKERQAQALAFTVIKAKKQANPDMDKEQERKMRQQELSKARARVGAKRRMIDITPREWEAIQAGAISSTKLEQIIKYVDDVQLKQLATPRTSNTNLSTAKVNRLKSMSSAGYTTAEIAETLGISPSTVTKYLSGKE